MKGIGRRDGGKIYLCLEIQVNHLKKYLPTPFIFYWIGFFIISIYNRKLAAAGDGLG